MSDNDTEASDRQAKPRHLAALALLAAVLFFANTWGYDLWPADEPRFGQVAREMMESGNYLAPSINGQPYKEKPPLLFWAITLASKPFGDVTEFSARVPSGIAGTVMVLLTYLLATQLYGRRTGFWSAAVLMTMLIVWREARAARTDMLLGASMTAALYTFQRWHEDKQTKWLVALYAAIIVGLYAKGPAALIFPLLLIVAFYWKRRDERRRLHWVIGFTIAIAAILLWFIPARMALPTLPPTVYTAEPDTGLSMGGELFRQTIGRFLLGVSKAAPPWEYFITVPLGLVPWTLFLPWAIPWVWKRRREDDRMRLLLSWTVPAFIFFSICIGKRDLYLLPIYPALAILIARSALDLADGDRAVWRKRAGFVWAAILVVLGLATFLVPFTPYRDLVGIGLFCFAGFALAAGLYTLIRIKKTAGRTLHAMMAIQFGMLALIIAMGVFPLLNKYKGAGVICEPLRKLSLQKVNYRLYTIGFSREEYIFYSRHPHTPVLNDLLPVKLSHKIDLAAMAKQQRKLRKAVAEAAGKVDVASPMNPTPQEIETLRAAVHQAVTETKVDPDLAPAFEQSLKETVDAFAREFDGPAPAFVFVQQEDLKWMLPLFPDIAKHTLVREESVGRRDMVLLGNQAGIQAIEK